MSKKNKGILEGLKVVDCSQILAGPFCSMNLADMGANVIKVEKPNGGDDTRSWGPPFKNNQSIGFMNLNRNKESIVINFKDPEGIKIMKKLVNQADVLIENYRTGTMERLGLGYEDLKKVNKTLIYCSISGFVRTGPYAKRAGFDLVAQGMSGLMSITGHPDAAPSKVGVPIADLNTGMYALSSILAAYINRLKNNEGQHIEVSLLESAIAYTVWETDSFDANFFERLLEYDQLLVPSQWQKDCAIEQGYPSPRVNIVPEAVEPDCLPSPNISPDDSIFTFCLLEMTNFLVCF